MDLEQAVQAVTASDEAERNDRAARLVELALVLGEGEIGISGQAASWLFEDVKATWLYGHFAALVVTAHAFCLRQLAGALLALPDDPGLSESSDSLDDLAALCYERGLVGIEQRADLVALHDAASAYTRVSLIEQDRSLERHLVETELFAGIDSALLRDARSALRCCVAVLHRRRV